MEFRSNSRSRSLATNADVSVGEDKFNPTKLAISVGLKAAGFSDVGKSGVGIGSGAGIGDVGRSVVEVVGGTNSPVTNDLVGSVGGLGRLVGGCMIFQESIWAEFEGWELEVWRRLVMELEIQGRSELDCSLGE